MAALPVPTRQFGFCPPQRRITVRCKIVGGAEFEFDLNPSSSVRAMKLALGLKLKEQGCGLAVEQFRLLAKGQFLVDDAIVQDCKVVKGSKLLLMDCGDKNDVNSTRVKDCDLTTVTAGTTGSPPAEVLADAADLIECEAADVAATAAIEVIHEWDVGVADDGGTPVPPEQTDTSHCWACSKHVGLTGVPCRCGFVFCAHHRYAESHDCHFNHQEYHRGLLAKQLIGSALGETGVERGGC